MTWKCSSIWNTANSEGQPLIAAKRESTCYYHYQRLFFSLICDLCLSLKNAFVFCVSVFCIFLGIGNSWRLQWSLEQAAREGLLNCTIGKSVEENLIWNKRIFLGVAEEHVSKRWPFNYFQSCEFAGQSLERGQNSYKNSRPKCVDFNQFLWKGKCR